MSFQRPTLHARLPVVGAALVLALALQTTVLNAVAIGEVKPDLVLVVAICVGLLAGPGAGAVCGAAAGLLEGYAQGLHLGSLGVSRTVAAFVAGTVETQLMRDKVVVPAATGLMGSLVAHVVYFVLAPELPIARPLRIAVVESLYNMLLTPPVYLALARWGFIYRR